MKKIALFILFALAGTSAFAQKSYITVFAHPNSLLEGIQLTGDVPSDIDGLYYNDNNHSWYSDRYYSMGEILNILSGYGYEIEFMEGGFTSGSSANNQRALFVLSKNTSNPAALSGDVNKDGKVNVSDVTQLVNIILGIIKQNPNLLK